VVQRCRLALIPRFGWQRERFRAGQLESEIREWYTVRAKHLVGPNTYNGWIQGVYPAVLVQSGSRFQTTIGCEYSATACYVTYRLDYRVGSGPIRTFWTFRERYEGLVYNVDLSLGSLAGQNVQFILFVSAYGTAEGDRALWGNPVITDAGGTPPPPPPPPGAVKYFDFGTASSPLASGYTRVTESTGFTSGAHGWTNTANLSSRDRTALADDLKRDFVMNDTSAARVFQVALVNGTYNVGITMGDQDFAHDNMVVKANGTTVLAFPTLVGGFAVNTVTECDRRIPLEFSDASGSDQSWVVNAVNHVGFHHLQPPVTARNSLRM
jgi:hypothetical protein